MKLFRRAARFSAQQISDTHQPANHTWSNRYPDLFSDAAKAIADPVRILSYGCSTGEECWTLRHYFPNALVVGADINPLNIHLARARNRDPQVLLLKSNDDTLQRLAPFDAVFCLAVLTRATETRRLQNCSDVYPFHLYRERVSFLDSLVAPGGLLAIHGGSYRFSDTPESANYDAIPTSEPSHASVVVFDAKGDRLNPQPEFGSLYLRRLE